MDYHAVRREGTRFLVLEWRNWYLEVVSRKGMAGRLGMAIGWDSPCFPRVLLWNG